MGSAFSCLPRYGWCVPKHNPNLPEYKSHTSTPRSLKGHRRNLSAAFNMADLEKEHNVEKVNINTASEEELMTLPNINRQTARNIIEYRSQIGTFKKIEDLALVSGVGATKLNHLRSEICVSHKKSSLNSSLSGSHQDVSYQDNTSRTSSKSQSSNIGRSPPRINLNTSNVFQLMRVKGLTQQLAENIVMYRDKKGLFKCLDDLIRVKGINPGLLSAIRPHLTLHDQLNTSMNSSQYHYNNSHHHHSNHHHSNHARPRKTSSAQDSVCSGIYPHLTDPHLSRKIDSQEDLCSMYGPLGRRSLRKLPKLVSSEEVRESVVRVASWNLQQCSLEKADNPGVKEVFAMTLLENQISIIAVQELSDPHSLQKLCDELNEPTIPNVRKWAGTRGTWQCVTSPASGRMFQGVEHLGFLWDSSRGIQLQSSQLLEAPDTDTPLARKPFLAVFQLPHYYLATVNVHLKSAGLNNQDRDRLEGEVDSLSALLQSVRGQSEDNREVVILGDFNLPPDAQEFSAFGELGYSNVFHQDQYTNISTRNPEGSTCYDNVWLGQHAQALQTGGHEVVRDGLASPWIPDGWGWGGMVSDHCPLFVELRAQHSKQKHVTRVEDVNLAFKMSTGGSA